MITIGPDGVFVATAIGYGFDEERGQPLKLEIGNGNPLRPGNVTLGQVPAIALIDGVRVNPAAAALVFAAGSTVLTDQALPRPWLRDNLLERVKEPRRSRSFSACSTAQPAASCRTSPQQPGVPLGASDGEQRSVRLSPPLTFWPRSTLGACEVNREPERRHRRASRGVSSAAGLLGLTACPEEYCLRYADRSTSRFGRNRERISDQQR